MPFELKKKSRKFTSKNSDKEINYCSYFLDEEFIEKILGKENFKALKEDTLVMVHGNSILDTLLAEEHDIKIQNDSNRLQLEGKIHRGRDFRELAFEFARSTTFTISAFIVIIEKKENKIFSKLLDFFDGMDHLKYFRIKTIDKPPVAFGYHKNDDAIIFIKKVNKLFEFFDLIARYGRIGSKNPWVYKAELKAEIEKLAVYIPCKDDGTWYQKFIKTFSHGYGQDIFQFMREFNCAGYFFPHYETAKDKIYDICGIIDTAVLENKGIKESVLIAMLFSPSFIVQFQRLFSNNVEIASAVFNAAQYISATTKLLIPSNKIMEIYLIWTALINDTNIWRKDFDAQAVFNFVIRRNSISISPISSKTEDMIPNEIKEIVSEPIGSNTPSELSAEEDIGTSRRVSKEESNPESAYVSEEDDDKFSDADDVKAIEASLLPETQSPQTMEAVNPQANTVTFAEKKKNNDAKKERQKQKREEKKLEKQKREEGKKEKEEISVEPRKVDFINETPRAKTSTSSDSTVKYLLSFFGFKFGKENKAKEQHKKNQKNYGKVAAKMFLDREIAERNLPSEEKPPQPKPQKEKKFEKKPYERKPETKNKKISNTSKKIEEKPTKLYSPRDLFKFAFEEPDDKTPLNFGFQYFRPIYLTLTSPLIAIALMEKNTKLLRLSYFLLLVFYMSDHNYKQYRTQSHTALGINYFRKVHFLCALAFALFYEVTRFVTYEDTSKNFMTMDNLSKVHWDNLGVTFFIFLMLGNLLDNRWSAEFANRENNLTPNAEPSSDSSISKKLV